MASATESIASSETVYDPKNDLKRKAKSNDPEWKYGYWPEIGNRDKVMCILCNTPSLGGIKRLKEHLAGGYSNVVMCSNTTTEIRKEMGDYLTKNKRSRPIFLDDKDEGGGQDMEVVAHGTESQDSTLKPSSGTADQRRSWSFQSTMEANTRTKDDRYYVNKQWALWFYECGIPFNAANSKQFEIACEASVQYGSGYKPPSFHELREPLLRDCVKETSTLREEHERAWKQYGCTLMSDGWSDRKGRHLINFLVNSLEGTYFLESVDASSEQHDATMIANLLEERIEAIGKDKVVQVVTENSANYKVAGKLLMERIPTLFWSPCATHCLDLMLEDIAKLKEFKKPIARAKRVTTFIYRHERLLSAIKEKTGGMDLVRPATSRFATAFLTLKSMHKHKDALKCLFASESWIRIKLSKTEAGMHVTNIVLSKEFWNSIEDCLRASAPLLIVLRVVDGDEKPAMPEVAALMAHAKEKIKVSFSTQNKQHLLKKIMNIIERRWVKQMEHPLYGAALYLNPGKFFAIQKSGDDAYVGELRSCFNDVLVRMVQDENIQNKIDEQALHYEDKRGDVFSNKLAIQNLESMSPIDWWHSYGGRAIDLQRFAKRVVSLCASSSGCEQNWSTFEFIHTKKRNRLLYKRLNDLVFVTYNQKIKTRFQMRREKIGKNYDPLVIEDFDWDNEWTDSFIVPPQGGRECDLTWDDVDEAIGVSRLLRGRNLLRQANRYSHGEPTAYQRRARSTTIVVEEDDLDEQGQDSDSGNEEDEEEDPHDDADVSDCDEAPNATEDGENLDSTSNTNEFDDRY